MSNSIGELYQRWSELMDLVFSGAISLDRDNYPTRLENRIQEAVELKRSGKFEDAVSIYLDIIDSEKRIYPAILEFMYKSVLCSGRIDFAYEVIAYAEGFAKKAWGPSSWMGPWSQETKRRELENVLAKCSDFPTTFLNGGEPTDAQNDVLIRNLTRRNQILEGLMRSYSGGATVTVPLDADNYLHNAYRLYLVFRKGGVIQN